MSHAQTPAQNRVNLISHGPGHGSHGCRDWGVGPGAPVPPLLRGHHTRQLSLEVRPRPSRQAPLLSLLGRCALLPFIRILFQSALFGPHAVGLHFHGPISLSVWHHHVLPGIRLSHWLVIIILLKFASNDS